MTAGQQVTLQYQGADSCPDVADGFTEYPDGLLRSVSYPDGSSTRLFYVDVAGKPRLARVVDHPHTRDSKASVGSPRSVDTKLSLMFGFAIGHNLAKAGPDRIRAGP